MTANAGQGSSFNQRFIRRIKPAILTVAVTASALCGAINIANAQPATCDPLYWDSLKAKAWTEAEREIEQNQNYIYKADSVLQYTCFNQFANVLAANAKNMFSEANNPNWGTIDGTNMEQALQNLVGKSLKTYLDNNFTQNYLGDFSSLKAEQWDTITSGAYNCDQMKQVWTAAKCQDFANKATSDGKADTSANTDFFYMSTYNGNDYRKYPTNSVCQAATTWAETYATSLNTDDHYTKEKYEIYDKFFKPQACGDPGIIKTGVRVRRVGGQQQQQQGNNPPPPGYDEIICVKAGCASNADGTACE